MSFASITQESTVSLAFSLYCHSPQLNHQMESKHETELDAGRAHRYMARQRTGSGFVQRHKTPTNQLVVALLLKYFQTTGRFPYRRRDIPRAAIDFISRQLQIEAILLDKYSWRGRTIKYHRRTIRDYLGFREGTVADGERMAEWLVNNVVADESKGRPPHGSCVRTIPAREDRATHRRSRRTHRSLRPASLQRSVLH